MTRSGLRDGSCLRGRAGAAAERSRQLLLPPGSGPDSSQLHTEPRTEQRGNTTPPQHTHLHTLALPLYLPSSLPPLLPPLSISLCTSPPLLPFLPACLHACLPPTCSYTNPSKELQPGPPLSHSTWRGGG